MPTGSVKAKSADRRAILWVTSLTLPLCPSNAKLICVKPTIPPGPRRVRKFTSDRLDVSGKCFLPFSCPVEVLSGQGLKGVDGRRRKKSATHESHASGAATDSNLGNTKNSLRRRSESRLVECEKMAERKIRTSGNSLPPLAFVPSGRPRFAPRPGRGSRHSCTRGI